MSDKRNLKAEYIELKKQTAPDLWDRIECGLEEKTQPKAESVEKNRIIRLPARALAAAACIFVCITAVYVSGIGNALEPASGKKANVAMETTAGQEYDRVQETSIMQESAKLEQKDAESYLMSGTGQNPDVHALSYQSLSFESSSPVALPETVKTVEHDMYFSEAVLADTDLLCEGQVKSVSFDYDSEGSATAISYEIEVKQILYSEDYAKSGERLTVKSEIDEDAVSGETILYALSENRTYLLPLAAKEQAMWLVFPFAPQIEVTKNREYLFHNGWQSLVNEDSYVVLNAQAAPEDFYFDRMYLRKDSGVVDELVSLAEAMHR